MSYAEYQEWFEKAAEAESKHFDAMPVADVISDIRNGRLGQCYQIWYSLARRAQPEDVNDLLLAFLSSKSDYLHRYHCAAALIQVNRLTGWQPDELSAENTQPVSANLEKVRVQLAAA